MAGEILTCVQYDAAAQTCAVQAWMPPPSFLPVLSVADAALLGTLLVANWALAYAFNRVEKSIRQ